MEDKQLVFRVHALQQMFARDISELDVRAVIEDGEVIESRQESVAEECRIVLGWVEKRPLHVVLLDPRDANILFVLTAYEPTRSRWSADFRRRMQ